MNLEHRVDDTARHRVGLEARKLRPLQVVVGRITERRSITWKASAKQRLLGPAEGLAFDTTSIHQVICKRVARRPRLCNVRAINEMVIRHQYFRGFSGEKVLKLLLRRMPNLRKLRLETWSGIYGGHDGSRDWHTKCHDSWVLMGDILQEAHHLDSVSLFEDTYQVYQPRWYPLHRQDSYARWRIHPSGTKSTLSFLMFYSYPYQITHTKEQPFPKTPHIP